MPILSSSSDVRPEGLLSEDKDLSLDSDVCSASDGRARDVEAFLPRIPEHRFQYLDGLRGLAALFVLYSHVSAGAFDRMQIAAGFEHSLWWLLCHVADVGKIGVVLFFAISGFIIPESLSLKFSRPLIAFAVSRFFRLYPAYWLSIAGGVFLYQVVPHHSIEWGEIFANATMMQTVFGQKDIIGVYWTLFIELVFYIVCAILFVVNKGNKPVLLLRYSYGFLFISTVLAALRFYTHRKLPIALFLALAIMLWAPSWRAKIANPSRVTRAAAYRWLATFLIFIPLVSYLAYNFDAGFGEVWYRYTISYVLAIGVFVICTQNQWMNVRPLVAIGAVSYSIYLFHPLVDEACRSLGLDRWFFSPHLQVAVVAVLTCGIALVCYRFLERPMVRIGHSIRSRLSPKYEM